MKEFLGPAISEMPAVEKTIRESIQSADSALREPAAHLLNAGGKRLRPALVVLSALCYEYDARTAVPAAAAVEMIHMATLIHDDIIDDSATRRGIPTVNTIWGARTGLLSGDYLFAKAFVLLSGVSPAILRPVAAAVDEMCLGQAGEADAGLSVTEGEYLKRIERKTAGFMSACCWLGSSLGRAPHAAATALSSYGRHLGMAFQVVDDILDIIGDPAKTGKPAATDLRQGVLTLPVIHCLKDERHESRLRELLDRLRRQETDECVADIVSVLQDSGSLSHARMAAESYAKRASVCLRRVNPCSARDALASLPEFVLDRSY